MSYILLVEDDALSRMVVEDILKYGDLPLELVCVETGEEALERTADLQPILILMDIMLPGIDGLETTRQLKLDPLTQNIPVWALTGCSMSADGYDAIAAGCTTYVPKPIHGEEFFKQLCEFLLELSESENWKSTSQQES